MKDYIEYMDKIEIDPALADKIIRKDTDENKLQRRKLARHARVLPQFAAGVAAMLLIGAIWAMPGLLSNLRDTADATAYNGARGYENMHGYDSNEGTPGYESDADVPDNADTTGYEIPGYEDVPLHDHIQEYICPIDATLTVCICAEMYRVSQDGVVRITRDFEANIPFIAPGEVMLLGVLGFEKGDNYIISISAAQGQGLFAGVTNNPDITGLDGETWWRPLISGSDRQSCFTHHGEGYVFLFVGSSARAYNPAPDTELFDVHISVSLQVAEDDFSLTPGVLGFMTVPFPQNRILPPNAPQSRILPSAAMYTRPLTSSQLEAVFPGLGSGFDGMALYRTNGSLARVDAIGEGVQISVSTRGSLPQGGRNTANNINGTTIWASITDDPREGIGHILTAEFIQDRLFYTVALNGEYEAQSVRLLSFINQLTLNGPADLLGLQNITPPEVHNAPITPNEAMEDPAFSVFLPINIPHGLEFTQGSHWICPNNSIMYLQWWDVNERDKDNSHDISWTIQTANESHHMRVQSANYGATPAELWHAINHPIFPAEELTLELVQSRATWVVLSDSESFERGGADLRGILPQFFREMMTGTKISFGVLFDDVVVEVNSFGLTPEEVYDLFQR